MDPNAAYGRWRAALKAGDFDEASEAWDDLNNWIRNGGFEPSWTLKQRRDFMTWTLRSARENPTKRESGPTTLVQSGTLRGVKYEIRSYPGGRSLSGPILHYIVRVQHGDGYWAEHRARTMRGAQTEVEKATQDVWRYENKFQQTPEGKAWLEKQNPLSMNPLNLNRPEKIAIVAGVYVGLAALAYYLLRPAAAAATPAPAPNAPVTIVLHPGNQAAVIPSTGLTIALPAGAVWSAGVSNALLSTSTPIVIPPPTAAMTGQTGSITLTWTDSSGTAQITTLTLTD